MRTPRIETIIAAAIVTAIVLAILIWAELQDTEVHIFRSLFPWLFGDSGG